MTVIQHAIWLYHHFPLSCRDVQELLHQRGIQVSIVVNGRPSWAGRTHFSTPARMRTPGRFPMTIIQHAIWLYHRFPLSYRDVQELLHQRGIEVSHETLREWCIKFATLFTEELHHQEPRRGSRWHLDEVWILSANSGR